MSWSTACPDWEYRLLNRLPLVPDLPLFDEEAARALRIFKRLKLPDVIGQPTMAEAAADWFFAIVEALFGSYDPETNRRMIQEFFLVIPKKNAKSSNGGALMVVALIVNRRPEGEFLLVAPTKEIADIAFKQASGTIRVDPELEKLFHIQRHIRLITNRRTGATLQIKAADTDVITGSKALGTMIDETHVFAARPRAAEVFVELRGALAARPDGFLFQTTTQSKSPPSGVFRQELMMARAVRDGKMDLPLLPIIYELPHRLAKDGGWKRRELWPLVNPNLGRSVDEQFLEREIRKAEEQGPEALALLASQHFNVEIGLSLLSDRWRGADHWEHAEEPGLTLDAILERSEVCTVGIDGGGLDDLLAGAVVGRERVTRRWLVWAKAWVHESVLQLRKSEASRLRDLEADGDLIIVDDMEAAFQMVADVAAEVNAVGLLSRVGLDPMGVGAVVDALAEREIEGADRVVGISQGWTLNGAIKTAEIKLANGTMVHCGQALMAWAVGNAKTEPKGNAITITKAAAGTGKIDPLMALFDAVMLMSRNPEAMGPSLYESPEAYENVYGSAAADSESRTDWDRTILNDMKHPDFLEHKARFERWQDAQSEDAWA